MSNLRKILVVDIEATCWEPGKPIPENQRKEIIQIGICSVELSSGKLIGKRSILVRPYHSKISAYCTALTGLTWDVLKHGVRFMDACRMLEKLGSKTHVWASFGSGDRRLFQKQCSMEDISYPFGEHLDISLLYSLWSGQFSKIGLKEAMSELGVIWEGVAHHAEDDAWNAAKLFTKLLRYL